ncbi:hypothetical protein BAUCODRAFT_54011, partial [Baudoinia panamericana UAMH 10762]
IEIEAKIGRILRKDSDERIVLPVMTPTVLEKVWAEKQTRFESQMDVHEHRAMNEFLNACATVSHNEAGRVAVRYSHPRETDSFRTLSPLGHKFLPAAVKRHTSASGGGNSQRGLKLRTTTDNATGKVTARIVKVKVADLHIFNPGWEYDCRISLNLEANMLSRPDLPPYEDLVVDETTPAEGSVGVGVGVGVGESPDRNKDRLSYNHLCYRVDLTKVEVKGVAGAKYELELEVDAHVLREQMGRLAEGRESGFVDVVSGFLDDATLLMRQ